jgi:DNA primase
LEEQVDAEINVLQLPAGQDPDEVIMHTPAVWSYAVAHPLPLVDYYFTVKTAGLNLREPNGKTEAARRLLPVIGMISDRIKRDAYLRKLATMISMDERLLHDELQRVLRGQKTSSVVAAFSGSAGQERGGRGGKEPELADAGSPDWIGNAEGEAGDLHGKQRQVQGLDKRKADKVQWEDYLIGLLLQNSGLCLHVCGIINHGDFAGTDTRELYHILNSVYQQRASSPSLQPVEQFVPSELLETVARALKCVESSSPKDGAGLIKEAIQCATRLKRTRLLQLNTELTYLIDEAVRTGDSMAVRQLSLQLSALQRELRTIYSATHLQG